jgi:hypothetical protein
VASNGDTFIEGSEIWVPQGDRLQYLSGAYGRHSEFARVSALKTFRRGEGLPGAVWESGRPQIWQELGAHFVRREIAHEAGIEAALGFPIFRDEVLVSVVVLLCGRRDQTAGCIEIWNPNHAQGYLEHAAGYYGTSERFGQISRTLQFQTGSGLPGLAWERGIPQLVQSEGVSSSFLRASLARECKIESGIAIPIFRGERLAHVLVLLSSAATPIARAFEVWVPHQKQLLLEAAHYEPGLEAFAESNQTFFELGDSLPGRALLSGLPVAMDDLAPPHFPHRQAAAVSAAFRTGLAIPVLGEGGVRAVACLLS